MFGQLRDRDSPQIPVNGIWQFDLHPKLWEKELSKTWRSFKKGEEERENFFSLFKNQLNVIFPTLTAVSHTQNSEEHSDTKIWERTKDHKSLFVGEEMTKSIPAHPFSMRKPHKAILSEPWHRRLWHTCVHMSLYIQNWETVLMLSVCSISNSSVHSDRVGDFPARFLQFTQIAVFPGS